MRRASTITIILITVLLINVSVLAEEGWQNIRYFEEVSTFELKLVKYEKPLVFDWGKPINMSGSNDVLPDWHELIKTSSDLSDMTLEELRSLFTASCWPTIKVDESNFETFKKQTAKFPDLYPDMRYTLIYAETHVRIGGRTFMYLLKVRSKSIQEAREKINKRMKKDNKSHNANFLKQVDGKWKHHSIELDMDLLPLFKKVPLSVVTLGDIAECGKSYFDVDINPMKMMPLALTGSDD